MEKQCISRHGRKRIRIFWLPPKIWKAGETQHIKCAEKGWQLPKSADGLIRSQVALSATARARNERRRQSLRFGHNSNIFKNWYCTPLYHDSYIWGPWKTYCAYLRVIFKPVIGTVKLAPGPTYCAFVYWKLCFVRSVLSEAWHWSEWIACTSELMIWPLC